MVTHHAPHPASLPRADADLRWCDASDLSDIILSRGPDVRVHGRVHNASDSSVGRTRVVCNARGHINDACPQDHHVPVHPRRGERKLPLTGHGSYEVSHSGVITRVGLLRGRVRYAQDARLAASRVT